MMSTYSSKVRILGKYMWNNLPLLSGSIDHSSGYPQISVRTIKKHWDPKFKKQRQMKVKNHIFTTTGLTRQKIMKKSLTIDDTVNELGLQEIWFERDVPITSTPSIYDPYIIPEGDGKFSVMSKKGAKQKLEAMRMQGKSLVAMRKIRSLLDNFRAKDFPEEALDIYIKAHEALAAKEEETLIQYVTETAYGIMIENALDKTIHWRFIESLEPARLVQARCATLLTETNLFAQVTVRFHTQQILAVYDRFGRLMQGSEILRKDVLEYVVFERQLNNMYGKWRIHGKILPDSITPQDISEKTYIQQIEEEPCPEIHRATIMEDATEDLEKQEGN